MKKFLLLAASVLIIGNAFAAGPGQIPNGPTAYRNGWQDGCSSARFASGQINHPWKHDVARSTFDRIYKSGWTRGFLGCKSEPVRQISNTEHNAPVPLQTAMPDTTVSGPSASLPQSRMIAKAETKPAAPMKTDRARLAVAPSAGVRRYRVQLSSVRTAEGAQREWARLQHAFPDLLTELALTVQRVTLGERGAYYSIRTGEFADATGARMLCAKFKLLEQACLVLRR